MKSYHRFKEDARAGDAMDRLKDLRAEFEEMAERRRARRDLACRLAMTMLLAALVAYAAHQL